MAFKIALIFAILAYVSAGAIDSGIHHSTLPVAIGYNQHPQLHHGHQAISYADHTQGHLNEYAPHSYAGVPAQVYSAPITKAFAVPAATAGHGYAHTVSHGQNYGYSGHGYNFAAALPHGQNYGYAGYGHAATPLTTYGHHGVVAPVVADHTAYAHGGHVAYNKHAAGHYVH
ncbi:hypothetical protein pipiens_014736 [Culex pipiens pipiens]|uniref:Cuticle protein n=1 Tax=Culex pipiens pipiens TaxID=38569 RepID=A0ABD1CTI7_CULPP